MALLEILDLAVEFGSGPTAVCAVDGVSLRVAEGQTVCLVGESGSGKSVTGLSIARLLPSPPAHWVGGEILLAGRAIRHLPERELRAIRGRVVAYIFQEPAAALNPVLRVGDQIREMLELHRPAAAHRDEVTRLLELTGIPAAARRARDYPHQLSGGMLQRVMIAMALAAQPRLLVADEPTTALDVTIQAQILELLTDLRRRLGMSILLITHHLGIVAEFAERVAIMYAGQIVEEGHVPAVLANPLHPYTRALLNAVPRLGAGAERLANIPGQAPPAGAFPSGCRFHPRCPRVESTCRRSPPQWLEVLPDRHVRCPLWALSGPDAG